MKKIERKHYETPSSRIYEVAQQGVLCQRVTRGSVKGCLFTSRNNGAQIFIPDGSYWTNILSYAPAYGRYDYPYASEYEFGAY